MSRPQPLQSVCWEYLPTEAGAGGLVCICEEASATCLPQSPHIPSDFGATEADAILQRQTPSSSSSGAFHSWNLGQPFLRKRRGGLGHCGQAFHPPRGLSGGLMPYTTITHPTAPSCSPRPPGDRKLPVHSILPSLPR